MDQLKNETTKLKAHFSLGEQDFVAQEVKADFSAMQAHHQEPTLGLRIVASVLIFLGLLHFVGVLLVPNYGSFARMHLFSASVGCLTIAPLTSVHVYTNRLRNLR